VRRLDRNGLPARRHRSRERDDSPGRSEHLRTAGGAEIDAAVLTARVGMRMIERERPQNRSVDRPGPRTRRRHRKRARTYEQDSKTPHGFLLVASFENDATIARADLCCQYWLQSTAVELVARRPVKRDTTS